MASSRIMVGLPVDSSPHISRSQVKKWSAPSARNQVGAERFRSTGLVMRRSGASYQTIQISGAAAVLPDIAAGPLTFLSIRNFLVLAMVAVFMVGMTAWLVRSNHLAVSHSYEISELTQQKIHLLEVNRQLKTELARVSSLDQLELKARNDLKLITPRQGQIVVLD